MGCDTYHVEGKAENAYSIHFSENDDSEGCLCTFPQNDGEQLTPSCLRSLALLGAAVTLCRHGEIDDDWFYIPHDIPKWVFDGINRWLPRETLD